MLGRRGIWRGLGLGLLILMLAIALGASWSRARARRIALDQVRQDLDAGRLGRASAKLANLADRWPQDGEILLLLGETEQKWGHREAALAAWDRVPPESPLASRAVLLRANYRINVGQYTPAEADVQARLSTRDGVLDYDLVRVLSRVYRFEGRLDEVRSVLRGSWYLAPQPSAVLREVWILEHAPMPVNAVRRALAMANDQDDRVWLARGNYARLAGDHEEARGWLDRCRERRPDDPAVWRARLDLAEDIGDVEGVWEAAQHLPLWWLDDDRLQALRAWLAARSGDPRLERRELTALVQACPGDPGAVERLAVLALEAGDTPEAERLRRRKAEIDRDFNRLRALLLPEEIHETDYPELAWLSGRLGPAFDARAWAILAEAAERDRSPHDDETPNPMPADLKKRAIALSAEFVSIDPAISSAPMLIDRLSDLRETGKDARSRAQRLELADVDAGVVLYFEDDAEEAGLRFQYDNGQTPLRLMPETTSGGVGLLDYDGDGWMDVYLVQGGDLAQSADAARTNRRPGDRLFHNRGAGTFEDVTERSGIADIAWGRGYAMGVTVGDYDNDGDPDLFVSRLRSYALYRNRGDGTFEDVTEPAGLAGLRDFPSSAAFADLDNDGDLDLYVCHYMIWDPEHLVVCHDSKGNYDYCSPAKVEPAPDHAFRNDSGHFVDVTEQSGLAETGGRGLGVIAADLDDDHLIDLYVANDGTANYLFRNLGGFRFEEVGEISGVAGSASGGYQAGMGVACGDLDGDERPDLLVTNLYGEGTSLYQNLGEGLFADRSAASGIGPSTLYLLGFGIAMADVTNTGRIDVMITNGNVNDHRPYYPYAMPCRLYANRPDGRLVDISDQAGACWSHEHVGRGLAAGDLDNDGRIDAVIVNQADPVAFFHNRSEHVGHFLTLRLEGTASNRDGAGARVTVEVGGRRQVSWRVGGGSYQSSNDPRLHFGLGRFDHADWVEIRWPSGRVDRIEGLPADAGYLIREGEVQARPLPGFPAQGDGSLSG